MSMGMENKATSIGEPSPIRFQTTFLISEAELVTTESFEAVTCFELPDQLFRLSGGEV